MDKLNTCNYLSTIFENSMHEKDKTHSDHETIQQFHEKISYKIERKLSFQTINNKGQQRF